ncbi:MAG: hypothetical protein ACP5RS_06485 [Thermoplasmata archaeon]
MTDENKGEIQKTSEDSKDVTKTDNRVTVRVPAYLLEDLSKLIGIPDKEGKIYFKTMSEAIRTAIENLIQSTKEEEGVVRLTINIPKKRYEDIEKLIKAGEYSSIDSFIQFAVNKRLEDYKEVISEEKK